MLISRPTVVPKRPYLHTRNRCYMQNLTHDDKALVLFSGGQDSTTCLFWAKDHFAEVHALGFDYGQKHRVEIEQAT